MINAHQIYFALHLASLAFAGIGVLYADHAAFDWLRGKIRVMTHRTLAITHWTVTLGLVGLVSTGLLLFWPEREYLLGQPLFIIKMCFVLALILNSFIIETLMHLAARFPYAALTARQKIPLFISGAVSGACWLGAGIAALILFGL
jgi:hypothetical protein